MRSHRVKASKETKKFFEAMSEHLADHFARILKAAEQYDETELRQQMGALTACFWSDHFTMIEVDVNKTLEQEVAEFTDGLKTYIIESVRKNNHEFEDNEERLH